LVSVYFESIPLYLREHTFIGRFLIADFPDWETLLLLVCLLELRFFRFKYVNFKYLLPQLFEFIEILQNAMIDMCHKSAFPLFDSEEVKIGENHRIHKIIDVLVQKFQADKKLFWSRLSLDNFCFARQTLFDDYIFLASGIINGPFDLLKFTVYHEYGHIYRSASKKLQYIAIFQKLLTFSAFFFVIYSNSKSNQPRDKTRLMLIFLSFSCLIDSIFSCFLNLLQNYEEFAADDFSMSLHDDLSGIEAFFLSNKEKSKLPRVRFTMLYPPWLPYLTHPSLYHRLQRQVS